jgi:hypothetical protein
MSSRPHKFEEPGGARARIARRIEGAEGASKHPLLGSYWFNPLARAAPFPPIGQPAPGRNEGTGGLGLRRVGHGSGPHGRLTRARVKPDGQQGTNTQGANTD